MVVQARRSGFMAQSGTADGANFIKAHPFFLEALTGLTSIAILLRIILSFELQKTHGISTLTFLQSPLPPLTVHS
ncbi:hypothetical protein B0H10DRAFT_2211219 [Mycena sp. CBHHK59/15]|nr:hypothetical protein B0H10DRAFT_2211219 [Mycena sp. CBHHK59/15]